MTDKKKPNPPRLGDKQIDLSPFDLVDLNPEEKRHIPKTRSDFISMGRQVLSVYPEFQSDLKLDEFDPIKLQTHLDLAETLEPYDQWLEKRSEQVKETRLYHLAQAYEMILKLYSRTQAATEFNPKVGHAFGFLGDHFGVGKRKSKSEDPEDAK